MIRPNGTRRTDTAPDPGARGRVAKQRRTRQLRGRILSALLMVLLVFLAAAGIRTVWTARRLSPADNARDAAAERPAMEQQDAAEAMQLSREAEKWESLSDGTLATENDAASGKDETVYVLAGPDGAVRSIIVNEQLRNPHGTAFLDDYSQLRGIENVNGYQTFTRDRDGKLIWEAGGKDISYQGTTDKALPVDVSVTYFLNGKETAPADLAGRSGQIRIRFDYTNHETRIVEELADGAGELTDGARDLDDGVGELTDGAGDLLSGLLEMNDDGISMLTKTFGENLPEAVERLKLIRAAGAAYQNFAGALPDENNSVKFIVRTSGIGTD